MVEKLVEKLVEWARRAPPPPRLAPLLNERIDGLLHGRGRAAALLDSLAHVVVEGADQLVQSAYKAVKYNLGELLGERRNRGSRGRGKGEGSGGGGSDGEVLGEGGPGEG